MKKTYEKFAKLLTANAVSQTSRIAVGLSGGVDSAVAAYLLKKQGFDISGVYLHCFDEDAPGCRGRQDRQDALKVAVHLKIPFQVLDFRKEYKTAVIGYFKKEYLAGRTPNPDVVCNRDIKFGLFLDWAIKNGFDYLATGHYAKLASAETIDDRRWKIGAEDRKSKIENKKSIFNFPSSTTTFYSPSSTVNSNDLYLCQPKDPHKDQTYFLWAVPRQKFRRVLFPLADFTKKQVRSLAKFAKIPVADKPDSTGICFVGEVKVEDFLKRLGVKERPGDVVIKVCQKQTIDDRRWRIGVEDRKLKVENKKSIFHLPSSTTTFYSPSSTVNSSTPRRLSLHLHADSCYRVIGKHKGVAFYTIGQRHGFEITGWPVIGSRSSVLGSESAGHQSVGPKPANREPTNQNLKTENRKPITDKPPLYVIEKDVTHNRLIVGFGAETYASQFKVSNLNWLAANRYSLTANGKSRLAISDSRLTIHECLVRLRHCGELIPCVITNVERRASGVDQPTHNAQRTTFAVHLGAAQRGIAAGQSAVFYTKKGIVLGGGVIQ